MFTQYKIKILSNNILGEIEIWDRVPSTFRSSSLCTIKIKFSFPYLKFLILMEILLKQGNHSKV